MNMKDREHIIKKHFLSRNRLQEAQATYPVGTKVTFHDPEKPISINGTISRRFTKSPFIHKGQIYFEIRSDYDSSWNCVFHLVNLEDIW